MGKVAVFFITIIIIKYLIHTYLFLFILVGKSHASHFGLDDALTASREINAFKTYFVGFSHRMDHYKMEKQLGELKAKEQLRVAPAFDGLCLNLETENRLVESSHFSDTVIIE